MKDKEDHLDSLQVFLKVKEQAIAAETNRLSQSADKPTSGDREETF